MTASIQTIGRQLLRGVGTIVVVVLACPILLYVVNAAMRSGSTDDQYAVWAAFLNSELLENSHDWGTDSRWCAFGQQRTSIALNGAGTFNAQTQPATRDRTVLSYFFYDRRERLISLNALTFDLLCAI